MSQNFQNSNSQSDFADMTYLSVSDQDYFAHIFMTSNSKHSFLSDDDWVYDFEVF